jgi:hypothetical protein
MQHGSSHGNDLCLHLSHAWEDVCVQRVGPAEEAVHVIQQLLVPLICNIAQQNPVY